MDRFGFADRPTHLVSILKFLEANGASRFAFEWLDDYLAGKSFWSQVTMILAPTDAAIQRLEAESGAALEEITDSAEGLEILLNHLSIRPTKTEWPMITALSDEKFGSTQADIEVLKPIAYTTIEAAADESVYSWSGITSMKTSIIVINSVIIHKDQLVDLKRYKGKFSKWWRPVQPDLPSTKDQDDDSMSLKGTELTMMNKDVFRMLVSRGQLRGKAVLALCTGNKDIATLCDRDNYFLYQQLLKSEFNYEWRPSDLPITAKDMYQKFHRVRLDVYARPESWPYSYILVQDDNVSDHVRSSIDKRFISDKRPYDYISIPMDGFIYIGGENQWVMYVRGKPRTAILIEIDYSENDDPRGIYEIAYGWNDVPDDRTIIYMSSNDLRDFIGNRQIVFLNANSRPMPDLFLGKPPTLGDFIMYLVTNNVPYAKVLLDGQEETIVTIPINKQGLL